MTTTQNVSRSSETAVPPQGSRIQVAYAEGTTSIVVPPAEGGYQRYFVAAFMLFWLGAWAVAFLNVSTDLAKGKGSTFLIFWLGAWTLGGAWAAYMIFRLVRPSIPERFELHTASIFYDSGRSPMQWSGLMAQRSAFAWSTTPRRIKCELPEAAIATLRLRETELRNRLTIDYASDRIELAKDASDIDREWLFGMLTARYGSVCDNVQAK